MTEKRLSDVLIRQIEEERERALRALLMRPLLAGGSEELALVRRHAEHLREWFRRETGWVLRVERECARLYKRPATHDDPTRGQRGFEREHYVVFCLACAVLERSDSQITLRALGERLLDAANDAELAARNFKFTFDSARERRILVAVCRLLLELGVLTRVAGDEESFVTQVGDALYDIHRRVLAALPVSARGASLIAATEGEAVSLEARLQTLIDEQVADSPDARRAASRHRIGRRLLDDPVIYNEELSDDERSYFATQRGPMAARLAEAAGLVSESRAEGVALVDPAAELSDELMPAVGTEAHATLLLAEYLAETSRTDPDRIHSVHELAAFVRTAIDRYGRYWRKDAREPGADRELAELAVARMRSLKLLKRVHGDGVQALPALLRFAIESPLIVSPKEGAR
jgi:uncharacterized protein (TIGR02678 family)